MAELLDRVNSLAERSRAKRREQRHAEAAAVEQKKADQAEQRDALRLSMPEVAGVVDRLRAVFGDDQVRVLAARENGHVVLNRRAMAKLGLDVAGYE
jgi:hypothetical protein